MTWMPIFWFQGGSNITLENLIIAGSSPGGYNPAGAFAAGIRSDGVIGLQINHVHVDNVWGDGLELAPLRAANDISSQIINPSENVSVNGLSVNGAGRQGVSLVSVTGRHADRREAQARRYQQLRRGGRPVGRGREEHHHQWLPDRRSRWLLCQRRSQRRRQLAHRQHHGGELHHDECCRWRPHPDPRTHLGAASPGTLHLCERHLAMRCERLRLVHPGERGGPHRHQLRRDLARGRNPRAGFPPLEQQQPQPLG